MPHPQQRIRHRRRPGETGTGTQCNNINILNNHLENFTGDAIQFGTWSNVTIDGNTIENMIDAAGNTYHNDGIQFTGNTQNATITNNYVAHSSGQLMLIQPAVGPIDNVVVENNVVWDTNIGNGGYAIQSQGITHAQIHQQYRFRQPLWWSLAANFR